MTRTLRGIEQGIAMLDERRAAYAPEPEPVAGRDDGYAPDGDYDEADDGSGGPDRRPPMSGPGTHAHPSTRTATRSRSTSPA